MNWYRGCEWEIYIQALHDGKWVSKAKLRARTHTSHGGNKPLSESLMNIKFHSGIQGNYGEQYPADPWIDQKVREVERDEYVLEQLHIVYGEDGTPKERKAEEPKLLNNKVTPLPPKRKREDPSLSPEEVLQQRESLRKAIDKKLAPYKIGMIGDHAVGHCFIMSLQEFDTFLTDLHFCHEETFAKELSPCASWSEILSTAAPSQNIRTPYSWRSDAFLNMTDAEYIQKTTMAFKALQVEKMNQHLNDARYNETVGALVNGNADATRLILEFTGPVPADAMRIAFHDGEGICQSFRDAQVDEEKKNLLNPPSKH